MKRFVAYGILILILLFSLAPSALAEETNNEKVSTLIFLKNDLVRPQQGKVTKGYFTQTFSPYFHYKWVGAGGDFSWTPKKDYQELKPYVTANKGPFYALLGYSGNSLEQKFIQTGGWYLNRFGKLLLFGDLRNYWSANKTSISYLDFFTHVSHPIGQYFYAGLETKYIHWWDPKKSHDWFLVGPLVGVNLTKTISVYARPSLDWNKVDNHSTRAFTFRVGLKFQF